jgi:hypothetical protein
VIDDVAHEVVAVGVRHDLFIEGAGLDEVVVGVGILLAARFT